MHPNVPCSFDSAKRTHGDPGNFRARSPRLPIPTPEPYHEFPVAFGAPPMIRRRFGNTPLEVSAISLGCWIFGVDWWGHYTDEQAADLCQFSYDLGITFFDNGDAYGNGRAETLFAKWLKESGVARDKIEIGSKFGYDFYSDPGEAGSHRERKQDFSPAFLRRAHEQSLKRLGVDHIDLYMAHNIKLPQFRDDTFAELEKMKDVG